MALTRPYAAPGEHRITEVPAGLGFLAEHPLRDTDLGHRPIESFRCTAGEDEELFRDTLPLVYHMDRSDSNLHVNMHVYPQLALDYLALSYHRVGGDAGRLRFRAAAAYFRRPFLPGDVAEVEIDLVTGRGVVSQRTALLSRSRTGTAVASASRWRWRRAAYFVTAEPAAARRSTRSQPPRGWS